MGEHCPAGQQAPSEGEDCQTAQPGYAGPGPMLPGAVIAATQGDVLQTLKRWAVHAAGLLLVGAPHGQALLQHGQRR